MLIIGDREERKGEKGIETYILYSKIVLRLLFS